MILVLPLTLTRLSDTGHETFGHLSDAENREICKTLELPWQDNRHDVSCIPAGIYPLRRRYSPKHDCQVFEVASVPGRSDIELHPGNVAADSLGCILLGTSYEQFGMVGGDVTESRRAFHAFMDSMDNVDTTTITVLPAPQDAGRGTVTL